MSTLPEAKLDVLPAHHASLEAQILGQLASDKYVQITRELAELNPLRFLQGELHELWKEAVVAQQQQVQPRPGVKPATHRQVPVGPYRLAVIPSLRARSAASPPLQPCPRAPPPPLRSALAPAFRRRRPAGHAGTLSRL